MSDTTPTAALTPTIIPQNRVPVSVRRTGEKAAYAFLEFFTARIRNQKTRKAYYRNALHFFRWTDAHGLSLDTIRSVHVAHYIEELSKTKSNPTAKQHLAAIRMLFDHLVVNQIVPSNPAAPVRGPRHSVTKGVTPVLNEEEARLILDTIDVSHLVGLRDRALIALMCYTFARIEAALSVRFCDYYPQGKRWWLRLNEKNSKVVEMPVHHKLEHYLDAYLTAAGFPGEGDRKKSSIFSSAFGRTGKLTEHRMSACDAWRMVRRRAKAAGILTPIGCHSFRATGITNYLINGGRLETAQKMAGHSDPRTTKLYDRRGDQLSLDEIEKISI